MNKVMLFGRLGRDPELRTTQGNSSICQLSVATTERYKDKNGEWQESADWHRVVVFGRQAEQCGQYLTKGRELLVEGRLTTRKWTDQSGQDRYTTEVVAQNVTFAGGKGGGDEPQQRTAARPQQPRRQSIVDELEDSIPF